MAGHVAIQDIEAYNVLGRTEKPIKAGDTTFQVRGSPGSFKAGAKIWMDVLAITDEVRTVSSVENRTVTVSVPFSFAHEPGAVFQRSDTVKYLYSLSLDSSLVAGGDVEMTGPVLVTGALSVEGDSTLGNVEAVALTLSGGLSVTGDSTLGNVEAASLLVPEPGTLTIEGTGSSVNGLDIYGILAPVTFSEVSDPAAPAANRATLFARDNGSGKTQLCVRFSSGAVQVIATQP